MTDDPSSSADRLRRRLDGLLPEEIRRRLDELKPEARRIAEMLHPQTFARLYEAGVFRPRTVAAGAGVLPWLLGRGPSLGLVSQLHAAARPQRPAIVDRQGTLSWRELDRRANRLARGLLALGVAPGDQIATLVRNGAEQVEAVLAAQKLGVVIAPLNTWATSDELATILERSTPAVLFYDTRHAGQLDGAVPRTVQLVAVGDVADELDGSTAYAHVLAEDASTLAPVARRRGSPELVIHTSGTTGTPKAASRDAASMAGPALVALLRVVPYRHDDTVYIPAPMFHSFGLLSLSAALLVGMTMVLPDAFDPEQALYDIDTHRITAASLVPVMVRRILDLPAETRGAHDVSCLRIVLTSGSSMSPELRRAGMEAFGDVLYDLYGSTEAGWVAIADPQDIATRPEAVGKPAPGIDVAILGPDGRRLPAGETGEIHARSGVQFSGYRSGESTDEHAGYLRLGDLGHLDDDGYLHVSGRADDMAVIGGENVYPIEVEQVIETVEGVDDVAVVGVPSDEYGQVLVAFVVGDADPGDVRAACERRLASFKVPRDIHMVDELPRTSTGKVLRPELRERHGGDGDD